MSKGVNDLEVYREAMELAEEVWDHCVPWKPLAQDTVGRQWIRSVDSIAANLSEGYGRYHFAENRRFCFYARGSLAESQTWLEKAVRRGLLDRSDGKALYLRFEILRKRINAYIGSIGPKDEAPTMDS